MGLSNPLGNLRTYTVTCLTTATSIRGSQAMSSAMIWNNSATPIFMGGADVDNSTKGMPFCTDGSACVSSSATLDVNGAFCLSTGGAATLLVMAGR